MVELALVGVGLRRLEGGGDLGLPGFELDDPFLYDFMTARQPIASLKIAKDISPDAFAGVDIESEYDAYFRSVYGVTYPDYQPVG